MKEQSLVLGIDLGTSGVRIALINKDNSLIYSLSKNYLVDFRNTEDWKISCRSLIKNIPEKLKERIIACSVDATSGTLVACKKIGIALGKALPYYYSSERYISFLSTKFPNERKNLSLYSSIPRALELLKIYGEDILLRHQADWITGWLLDNWELGEEGNNIKLGWNLSTKSWLPFTEKLLFLRKTQKLIF